MRAKKLIKRSLLAIAIALTAAAALSYWAFTGTPDFYQRPTFTAQQRADAAQRATEKFIRTRSWADDVWANEQRAIVARNAGSTQPATNVAVQPFTVSFTEQELNAFFEQWAKRWEDRYAKYIKEPAVVLRKDRLILCGTLTDIGAVASFHFSPAIDEQGRFRLTLDSVLAGRLPMPDMVWASQRARLVDGLRRRLPDWQREAAIGPSGIANNPAVAAEVSKIVFDVLNRKTREPVLFLPSDKGAVPAHVTSVAITDGELSLTVAPMSAAERARLLDRIREPDASVTAAAAE